MVTSLVKTLPANETGRDIVVGDLHGSLDLLQRLLDHLHFDTTRDRLISVGDLVDRGPDSLGCLELLYEPWFHAVMGNHEKMMLDAFDDAAESIYWTMNSGEWGVEALNDWKAREERPPADASARLFDLLPLVRQLPLVLTVQQPDGTKVHIIHAELPPVTVTDELLADPHEVNKLLRHGTPNGDFLRWGRYVFQRFYNNNLNNLAKLERIVRVGIQGRHPFGPQLSPIISGHTILQKPLQVHNQLCIDTGACYSYFDDSTWEALTCIDLSTGQLYQARPSGVTQVSAVKAGP